MAVAVAAVVNYIDGADPEGARSTSMASSSIDSPAWIGGIPNPRTRTSVAWRNSEVVVSLDCSELACRLWRTESDGLAPAWIVAEVCIAQKSLSSVIGLHVDDVLFWSLDIGSLRSLA